MARTGSSGTIRSWPPCSVSTDRAATGCGEPDAVRPELDAEVFAGVPESPPAAIYPRAIRSGAWRAIVAKSASSQSNSTSFRIATAAIRQSLSFLGVSPPWRQSR